MKKSLNLFTMMNAVYSDLPGGSLVYEANKDLMCAKCGAIIPANSYFGRKVPEGAKKPMQHCRVCLPFHIFDDRHKRRIVPVEEEYLFVSESA